MTLDEIVRLLDEAGATNVFLLCHHNSDPDAVCSAFAFQGLLRKVRPEVQSEIGTVGVSKLTRNLLKYVPALVNLRPTLEKAQAIILLDTNTIQQLDTLADRVTRVKAPLIVIDHH